MDKVVGNGVGPVLDVNKVVGNGVGPVPDVTVRVGFREGMKVRVGLREGGGDDESPEQSSCDMCLSCLFFDNDYPSFVSPNCSP